MKICMQNCTISLKNSIKLYIKTNNWQIVHVMEAKWISIYHSRFSPGMFKVVNHSYRPSSHLAISRPRGYSRTLASQSFCSPDYAIYTSTEKVPHAMMSVVCLFLAWKKRGNYRTLIRYETLFKTALTMLCFKKNPLTLYGDPRHNSHRGRILRIDEWTGTCRSVDWAWVCRGSKPPWCGGMPRYSGPGCPYLADKASLPLSSYFPFFSGRKIIQYNIALYLHQLGISFVFFKHFARKSNCFHLNVMAARYNYTEFSQLFL